MSALLDGKIAKLVANGLKAAKMTKPATLIKVVEGTRNPVAVSAGRNPTEVSYSARGLVATTKLTRVGATLIETGDRLVLLLGATIKGGAVPAVTDKITIEGITTRIIDIDRDPASAAYLCLTRA